MRNDLMHDWQRHLIAQMGERLDELVRLIATAEAVLDQKGTRDLRKRIGSGFNRLCVMQGALQRLVEREPGPLSECPDTGRIVFSDAAHRRRDGHLRLVVDNVGGAP